MASLRSESEESAEFSCEATAVAVACQEIIPSLNMKIQSVSRETGIISAKSVMFSEERTLIIKISHQDAKTKVTAKATAWEGLFFRAYLTIPR